MTAVVGAGVLGLPYAFSYLGWVAGPLFLALAASTSYYTSWQLAGMHERDGKRLNRYRDLGVDVLGPVWGRWAIVPFQFMVMVRPCLNSECCCEAKSANPSARPVIAALSHRIWSASVAVGARA